MKKHLSEQLIGLANVLLLVTVLVIGIFFIHKRDRARERKMEVRERVAFVKDSLAAAIAEKDSMRAVWAQQKHERDSMRPIWEAERAERAARHQQWEAEKRAREAAREAEKNIEIILQPFDPNTADSTTLVHLGLRPWMARSVVHYREKGGHYRKAEDFRKAYGMTDSLYQVLLPYITIAEAADNLPSATRYPQKKDTLLNLNTADTTELKLLRGIGSYTARKIVEYRKQLGGYASTEQLREITPAINNLDSILPHLWARADDVKKLYINRMSVDAMNRHKYLSFDQAKAIFEYRLKKGAIRSEETLLQIRMNKKQVITDKDLERLRPYISYDE